MPCGSCVTVELCTGMGSASSGSGVDSRDMRMELFELHVLVGIHVCIVYFLSQYMHVYTTVLVYTVLHSWRIGFLEERCIAYGSLRV